jgi:Na+/H+ antiporter NhaA
VMLGSRVPVELRVFLTAASIVDDIGTIAMVAVFYSSGIDVHALVAAALLVALLALLNRAGIYRAWPYVVTGFALWLALHQGGVHATLAGVLLALFIPTRPPPNLNALLASALVVKLGIAERPGAFNLRQVLGAGALAGIGFTMSLFIAGRSFPVAEDFAAAKAAIFGASVVSAVLGCLLLVRASPRALPAGGSAAKDPRA